MYGDTEVVRALAGQLQARGEAIRDEAELLWARAEGTTWSGVAAEAMRLRVRMQVGGLRQSAELHDEAAAALLAHAETVDRLKALIAAIEEQVRALVAAARDRLEGLAGLALAVLPDPVDELLAGFLPPPSGHRDWLAVDLPGLSIGSLR